MVSLLANKKTYPKLPTWEFFKCVYITLFWFSCPDATQHQELGYENQDCTFFPTNWSRTQNTRDTWAAANFLTITTSNHCLLPSSEARLYTSSKWITVFHYEITFENLKTFYLYNTLYKYNQFHPKLMRKLMNKTRLNWVYQRTRVHSSVATNTTMQSRHRSTSETETE